MRASRLKRDPSRCFNDEVAETPEHRSWVMSRVRNKDTVPEMTVRRLVHSMGYSYRLHGSKLPGRPDLVFKSRRKVIFVHGCFWHLHDDPDCKLARMPKSRLEYWKPKLERNRARDAKNMAALDKLGWQSLVVWECQLKDTGRLGAQIRRFLAEASDVEK